MLGSNRCSGAGICAISVVAGPSRVSSSGLRIHIRVPVDTAAMVVAVLACAVNSVQTLFG